MKRVGILYNPHSEPAVQLAEELDGWLQSRSLETWRGVAQDARGDPTALCDCSLMICLGGDGTVLRGAHLAIPTGTPLLPVALGHLSFMAEVTPDQVRPSIDRILAGDYWIEERTLASAHFEPAQGEGGEYFALNEILVGRGELARAVIVEVAVDQVPMTSYHADGIIVATATGSTAYALAAGGPVLDPRSHVLVLVAIAPHLTQVPALVLHDEAEVRLILRSRYSASLSIDGQKTIALQAGDTVTVRRATQVARFARVRSPQYFYQTLTARLRRE